MSSSQITLETLPIELHHNVSQYLTVPTLVNMGQTCQLFRKVYGDLSWTSITVIPDNSFYYCCSFPSSSTTTATSSSLTTTTKNCQTKQYYSPHTKFIPLSIFLFPAAYSSWYKCHLIKSIELSDSIFIQTECNNNNNNNFSLPKELILSNSCNHYHPQSSIKNSIIVLNKKKFRKMYCNLVEIKICFLVPLEADPWSKFFSLAADNASPSSKLPIFQKQQQHEDYYLQKQKQQQQQKHFINVVGLRKKFSQQSKLDLKIVYQVLGCEGIECPGDKNIAGSKKNSLHFSLRLTVFNRDQWNQLFANILNDDDKVLNCSFSSSFSSCNFLNRFVEFNFAFTWSCHFPQVPVLDPEFLTSLELFTLYKEEEKEEEKEEDDYYIHNNYNDFTHVNNNSNDHNTNNIKKDVKEIGPLLYILSNMTNLKRLVFAPPLKKISLWQYQLIIKTVSSKLVFLCSAIFWHHVSVDFENTLKAMEKFQFAGSQQQNVTSTTTQNSLKADGYRCGIVISFDFDNGWNQFPNEGYKLSQVNSLCVRRRVSTKIVGGTRVGAEDTFPSSSLLKSVYEDVGKLKLSNNLKYCELTNCPFSQFDVEGNLGTVFLQSPHQQITTTTTTTRFDFSVLRILVIQPVCYLDYQGLIAYLQQCTCLEVLSLTGKYIGFNEKENTVDNNENSPAKEKRNKIDNLQNSVYRLLGNLKHEHQYCWNDFDDFDDDNVIEQNVERFMNEISKTTTTEQTIIRLLITKLIKNPIQLFLAPSRHDRLTTLMMSKYKCVQEIAFWESLFLVLKNLPLLKQIKLRHIDTNHVLNSLRFFQMSIGIPTLCDIFFNKNFNNKESEIGSYHNNQQNLSTNGNDNDEDNFHHHCLECLETSFGPFLSTHYAKVIDDTWTVPELIFTECEYKLDVSGMRRCNYNEYFRSSSPEFHHSFLLRQLLISFDQKMVHLHIVSDIQTLMYNRIYEFNIDVNNSNNNNNRRIRGFDGDGKNDGNEQEALFSSETSAFYLDKYDGWKLSHLE